MDAELTLARLAELAIVPVVTLDDPDHAEPLGEALRGGGLPVAEITFRTDTAATAIERLCAWGGVIVGAGTVTTVELATRAVDAGAAFVVSPGLAPAVVRFCQDRAVPVFPGVVTPTEIMRALDLGLTIVKFFPAAALGGLRTLKALAAPFPGLRFIPTGGIDAGNMVEYLAHPSVLAVGGSWMVAPELIRGGRFDEVRRLTQQAVAARG